jgi:tRNA dimethylallyltransferase
MKSTTGHVVAVMGATATGKSEVAMRLADAFDGEIVSMDSRQVYRGLNIGTAKPSSRDQTRIAHHLIDIMDPVEANSAGRHIRLVREVLADLTSRGRLPLLVGGTGLYFRAFFHGLIDATVPEDELASIRRELAVKTTSELYEELSSVDPKRAGRLSARDRVRIARALEVYHSTGRTITHHIAKQERNARVDDLQIVLTMPRAALRSRIAERTKEMYTQGWVDEVRGLLADGYTLDTPAMNSLGYSIIAGAIVSGASPESTLDHVITTTQQYAKRQETFFRSMPAAHWIDTTSDDAVDNIKKLIKNWGRL